MIIYKDLVSGDEMFSDTYKIEKTHDGVILKVTGKHTTRSTDVDPSLLGANPSAEGGEEDLESASETGIDVILSHRLVETQFDKKSYQRYIKDYMKSLKERLENDGVSKEEVATFVKGATQFVKEVLTDFKEYQFFLGESMNADGQVVLVRWTDDKDSHPFLYFFRHGLDEEKV
jgi:hypothetical protein